MDVFMYLAKASALIALFYGAYWLLLKKETFFSPNRWFLLAGLLTSVLLPLVAFTKTVWVDPTPAVPLTPENLQLLMQYQAEQAAKQQQAPRIGWQDVALATYVIGILLFLARMLTDVSFIKELLKSHKPQKLGRYRLIDSPQAESPFSFFNYIVYNSALLKPHELESILAHEKVHSRQHHSFDMILGQLFCVVFWFNPFAWLYKKAIAQNLEFIADAGATRQLHDTTAYQKTLLKITLQPECIAITNHFYQSLIKKRIVMLNKQKSKRRNSWKYAVVMPALAAFVLAFQVKVVAQEKQQPAIQADVLQWSIKIDKDTKDSELDQHKEKIRAEFNGKADFSNIERNDKSEITAIKVNVSASGKNSVYEVSGNGPIQPFTINMEKNENGGYAFSFGGSNMKFSSLNDNLFQGDTILYDRQSFTKPFNAPNPMVFNTPQPFTMPMGGNAVALNFGNDDALVVINGVKYAKGQEIKLPPSELITSITTLDSKEGKKKYGKDGKKGVIEIKSSQTPFRTQIPPEAMSDVYSRAFVYSNPQVHFDNLDRIIIRADDFHFEDTDGIELNLDNLPLEFEFAKELSPEIKAQLMESMKQMNETWKLKNDAMILKMDEKMREARIKQNGHLEQKLEETREKVEQERIKAEKARAKAEEDRKRRN